MIYGIQRFSELKTLADSQLPFTRPNHPEQEQVVTLPSTAEEQVKKIESEIEQVLDKFDVEANSEFRLAILARISQKLMQEEK